MDIMDKFLTEKEKELILQLFSKDYFAAKLGISIVEFEAGMALAKMTVSDDMLNGAGVANGGVIFTLADFALAVAANTIGEFMSLTLGMNINYIKSALCGETIMAKAICEAKSNKIISCNVAVTNQNGEIIASAQGISYITSKRPG